MSEKEYSERLTDRPRRQPDGKKGHLHEATGPTRAEHKLSAVHAHRSHHVARPVLRHSRMRSTSCILQRASMPSIPNARMRLMGAGICRWTLNVCATAARPVP